MWLEKKPTFWIFYFKFSNLSYNLKPEKITKIFVMNKLSIKVISSTSSDLSSFWCEHEMMTLQIPINLPSVQLYATSWPYRTNLVMEYLFPTYNVVKPNEYISSHETYSGSGIVSLSFVYSYTVSWRIKKNTMNITQSNTLYHIYIIC